MNNPKYTFLLPAYKSHYLEESLKSIQCQSFQNFKVLVSDDCSPEPLKDIYDLVCSDDSRFSYRRNEENMGGRNLVSHWNLLVDLCDTEYLIMASDDDVYEPNYLEEIDKLVNKYPEVDLFRARVRKIDDKGNALYEEGPYKEQISSIEYIAQNYNNTSAHCVAHYVFRAAPLRKKGGFVDFPRALFSDDATAILMCTNGCANTSEICFNFRISGESVSSSAYDALKTRDLVQATLQYDIWFKKQMESLHSPSVKEEKLVDFVWYQHRIVVSSFFSWSVNCNWRDFWKLCQQAKKQGVQTLGCKVAFFKKLLSIR